MTDQLQGFERYTIDRIVSRLYTRAKMRPPSGLSYDVEIEVCISSIEFLAHRLGGEPSNLRKPDAETRNESAVDFSFSIDDQNYVLEHTIAEPYEGRIRDDALAGKLQEALGEELGGFSISGSRLQLMLPNQVQLSDQRISTVAEELAAWIKESSPQLLDGSPLVAPRHFTIRKISSGSAEFSVGLYRWSSAKFRLDMVGPAPAPSALRRSLDRTRRKKLGKLEEWRVKQHAQSVLVLEQRDDQLGDPFSTLAAIEVSWTGKDFRIPDTVLLFDSKAWTIWPLREAGEWGNSDHLEENPAPAAHKHVLTHWRQ